MTTVASLRAETSARQCAYVLFVEGIGTCWTDDQSGALLGSGAGTWIGLSEQDLIDNGATNEVVGQRTVKAGLVVPDAISFSLDPKRGSLGGGDATFKLLDLDSTLVSLFATEGKTSDVLAELIPASTTALGTSIVIAGLATTNPRGKYIGIERIGPSGQRGFFYPFPGFDMPGYEHFWNNLGQAFGVDPVLVSADPIVWEGRKVALYRLYRDHHLDYVTGTTAAGAWPKWREQHAAGGLVWWGVVTGHGMVGPERLWRVECEGPAALLRKRVGIRTNMGWTRIKAIPTLSTTAGEREDEVVVRFQAEHLDDANDIPTTFNFQSSIFDSTERLTSTTLADLRSELNTLIGEVAAGTTQNFNPGVGTLNNPAPGAGFGELDTSTGDAGMDSDGTVWIEKTVTDGLFRMRIVLHEKVWRWLGFDIQAQSHDGNVFEKADEIQFVKLVAGDHYATQGATQYKVPGPGYWEGYFDTVRVGTPWPVNQANEESVSNGGNRRDWYPRWQGGMDVLLRKGRQWIGLSADQNAVYCQGNLSLWWDDVGDPGSGAKVNRAGLFVIRGDYKPSEDADTETRYLPVRGSWRNAAWAAGTGKDDGILGSFLGDDFTLALYIEEVYHPRLFGFDTNALGSDWSSNPFQENPLEIMPLSGDVYFGAWYQEYADALLTAVLVSTGSATGYTDAAINIPVFTHGANDPGDATGTLYWHSDRLNASMGLAIPEELVADAQQIRNEFAKMPKGIKDPMNLLRIVWTDAVQAEDLLASITSPRRLAWSLHGRKYGVFFFGPLSHEDANASITESDLAGSTDDPASVHPSQAFKFTGAIDQVRLKWRLDPSEGGTREEYVGRAADPKARHRQGRIVQQLEDWGLLETVHIKGQQVTGEWLSSFFQLWQKDGAAFYAASHFSARDLAVGVVKGQDVYPGTKIRLTNQWLVDPSGSYGVTDHIGVVLGVSHGLKDERFVVEALMFSRGAPDQMAYYAPVAKLRGWDSATTTAHFYSDFRGIGDAAVHDLTGFAKPAWATGAGAGMPVRAYYWDGRVDSDGRPLMTRGPTNVVSTVDKAANTIRMTGAWSDPIERDWDVFVVPDIDDNQIEWVRNLYGPIVLDTTKTGSGTKGKEFL